MANWPNAQVTPIAKIGSKVTSAATADTAITGASYTVSAQETFYLVLFDITARLTTEAATATDFGTVSLRIGGTKLLTFDISNVGGNARIPYSLPYPIPVKGGVVVDFVCTPSAATSFTWTVNFLGYEG